MMVTHAIRIHRTGGPEVLKWATVEVGTPGYGQVLLRHTAVGLNFVDCKLSVTVRYGKIQAIFRDEGQSQNSVRGPAPFANSEPVPGQHARHPAP